MRQSILFLLANLLLCIAVSAQAFDYKPCRASLNISNAYNAPIMYTVTSNETIFLQQFILPHTTRRVFLPYLVSHKETCNSSVISLGFSPSPECVESVLSESHQYDACLRPHDAASEEAYKNVLLHLLTYGLKRRINFSITIIDAAEHPIQGHYARH